MRIVIAGGSGFLGRALRQQLSQDGHHVAVLTRRPRPGQADELPWVPDGTAGPWAALAAQLIADDRASGPFNISAPEPVTNADFTRALGRALHRPTVFAVPAFALSLALGELSTALLTGQRAVPAKAQGLGFTFRYSQIEAGLAAALRWPPGSVNRPRAFARFRG
jgi:NAD dependent epimerase/dehydratase family enzyme